jgi:hypothetical protein
MQIEKLPKVPIISHDLLSGFMKRKVKIDFYFPPGKMETEELSLLLINDGQDLPRMDFKGILEDLYETKEIKSLLCVGIHCGEDRRNEYGTAHVLNYKGQGAKAAAYTRFIFEELLPFIRSQYKILSLRQKSFCGFSLGGLSAMDIVWNHAEEFSAVGAFSGSFWWRTLSQDDPEFEEAEHMIMQNEVKNGKYFPWMKFFFETGALDETADRNKNGIIDSIDDTLSLMDELVKKGYRPGKDIRYLELKDGTHDVATWGRAFPEFLKWIC